MATQSLKPQNTVVQQEQPRNGDVLAALQAAEPSDMLARVQTMAAAPAPDRAAQIEAPPASPDRALAALVLFDQNSSAKSR